MGAGTSGTIWYAINLHFKNGIEGRIDILPTSGMLEEKYELSGEGFHVLVTCPFGRRRGWSAYRNGELVMEESAASEMAEDLVNGCYDETVGFVRALRGHSALKPSISDVVPSVEICMSIAAEHLDQTHR
jgi:hypothetical protein